MTNRPGCHYKQALGRGYPHAAHVNPSTSTAWTSSVPPGDLGSKLAWRIAAQAP
jgi:hypothetical protein